MKILLTLLVIVLIGVNGCKSGDGDLSSAGMSEAVSHVYTLFEGDDYEALANLYLIPPGQTREDNIRYAKAIIDAHPHLDYHLHGTRISGIMGVSLISHSGSSTSSPLYARWEDGRWKFFRSLVLWGNTNRLEHFGLSEQEMVDALKLREWVEAEKLNRE